MKNFVKYILLFVIIASVLVVGVACSNPDANTLKTDLTLTVGDSVLVQANEGFYYDYVYASSDESVATISSKGSLKALKAGTAIITAKRGEIVVYEYSLTVVKSDYVAPEAEVIAPVYRVVLDKYDTVIYLGGTNEIKASVYKNEYLVDESVVYSIADEEIATIEAIEGGVKVKAVKSGITTLSAKIGGFEAKCVIKIYATDVEVLPTPVITGLTEDSLEWNAVEGAELYKISLNGGAKWTETDKTSIALTSAVNPFQIRIIADSTGVTRAESNVATVSSDMIKITDGRGIKLLTDTTVAGNPNDKGRSKELSLNVVTSKGDYTVSDEFVSWTVADKSIAAIDGKTVTPVKVGKTEVTAKLIGGIVREEISVGTPISSKEDMDALAFAVRDGDNSKWLAGRRYILTNDIDYSNGGTAAWHERYLAPIAPQRSDDGATGVPYAESCSWGIFGPNINKSGVDANGVTNNTLFYASLDGAGYAIKNAVIPMGISGQILNYKYVASQNFIGSLAYGGELKNIAFIGLEYENPALITSDNPYYKSTNPAYAGTAFEGTGFDYKNYGTYSYWSGISLKAGLIGQATNAIIENVYVETKIRTTTWARATCAGGMLVAQVYADLLNHPDVPDNQEIRTRIRGCVVKATYDRNEATNAWSRWMGQVDNLLKPVGSLVGNLKTGLSSTVSQCYVISGGEDAIPSDYMIAFSDNEARGDDIATYAQKSELFNQKADLAKEYYIWDRIGG